MLGRGIGYRAFCPLGRARKSNKGKHSSFKEAGKLSFLVVRGCKCFSASGLVRRCSAFGAGASEEGGAVVLAGGGKEVWADAALEKASTKAGWA